MNWPRWVECSRKVCDTQLIFITFNSICHFTYLDGRGDQHPETGAGQQNEACNRIKEKARHNRLEGVPAGHRRRIEKHSGDHSVRIEKFGFSLLTTEQSNFKFQRLKSHFSRSLLDSFEVCQMSNKSYNIYSPSSESDWQFANNSSSKHNFFVVFKHCNHQDARPSPVPHDHRQYPLNFSSS